MTKSVIKPKPEEIAGLELVVVPVDSVLVDWVVVDEVDVVPRGVVEVVGVVSMLVSLASVEVSLGSSATVT